MAKKMLLVLVFAGISAGAVFAEEGKWYNSYAKGIDQGKMFINLGVGYGFSRFTLLAGADKSWIPPIIASFDFKVSKKVPITVGLMGGFTRTSWSYGSGAYESKTSYTDIAIGARGMYHFGLPVKNLDFYLGLTLGYVIDLASSEVGGKEVDYAGEGYSYFLYGFNLGLRYFFTRGFGLYLEAGYSGLTVAQAGLTFKF